MENTDVNEELNLDKKVTVKSIANWSLGFIRYEGSGDIGIPPYGSIRLSRGEIIAQIQNNNGLFNGIDGNGSHATLFIDDEPTRKEVGFDNENGKQIVLTEAVAAKLFALKTQPAFEKNLVSTIKTRAEKHAIVQMVKRLSINDYAKIRFTENYTGFKVQ